MGRASGLFDPAGVSAIAADSGRVKLFDRAAPGFVADPAISDAVPFEHPTLFARSIEWRVGALPGRCRLQLDTLSAVEAAPTLALRQIGGAQQLHRVGRRVSVTLARSDLPLFHGTVVHAEADLAADRLELTALDDRWLLNGIAAYGCIKLNGFMPLGAVTERPSILRVTISGFFSEYT